MIEAKDLRIDNWLLDIDNQPFQVTSIVFEQYNLDDSETALDWFSGHNRLYDCLPIPLEPEILVKMGFVKEKGESDEGGLFIPFLNGHLYWLSGNTFSYFHGNTPIMHYKITSVHQLQNIYHALTGKELEFTL